jgi:hypothetical protein
MQTLIENRETKSFFNFDQKEWKRTRQDATRFLNSSDAVRVCLRFGLIHVQLILQGADEPSQFDSIIPLD